MSLCIECAMQYHDYNEIRLSTPDAERSRNGRYPEAFIDGKKHRLNQVSRYHMPCDHCHRVSSALFMSPEEE